MVRHPYEAALPQCSPSAARAPLWIDSNDGGACAWSTWSGSTRREEPARPDDEEVPHDDVSDRSTGEPQPRESASTVTDFDAAPLRCDHDRGRRGEQPQTEQARCGTPSPFPQHAHTDQQFHDGCDESQPVPAGRPHLRVRQETEYTRERRRSLAAIPDLTSSRPEHHPGDQDDDKVRPPRSPVTQGRSRRSRRDPPRRFATRPSTPNACQPADPAA